MKAFIFLLVTFSLTSFSSSQQGWFQQSSGTANYLYAAYFVSPSTGWVVGQASTVLKTTNAGVNWFSQNAGAPGFLYSVYFISENTGWVVGQSGAVYKTTNAGANWSAQTSGFPSNYLYSVCFTDVSFGYIVGSGGLILKTMNGGNNWVQQTSGVSNTLSCVYFPPSATSMIGYAVGGTATEGVVLKTSSAGSSWTLQTLGTNWLFGVHFDNVQLGWAVGYSGTIYSTSNGGDNWILQSSGTNVDLFSVYFIDASLGWVVGNNGTILSTTNGGATFLEEQNDELPTEFLLEQNYPNPFNPSTKISWQSPIGSWQTLKIYDVLGNEVATIVDEYKPAGKYEVDFNTSSLPSGVYFYQFKTEKYIETKKMILLR